MDFERAEKLILQHLLNERKEDVYVLLSVQDLCVRDFIRVLDRLSSRGLVKVRNNTVVLSARGVSAAKALGLRPAGRIRCSRCDGTGYTLPSSFHRVFEVFKRVVKGRPSPRESLDQKFISAESVFRRVVFIHERGDLAGSRIFVVGDDDMLSLALALTHMPREVVAVDIDDRVVDFINRIGEELRLPVRASVYDVRNPLPKSFQKRFDVFVTDPTETIPALRLFLSRATTALRGKGCAGYFGMTTIESSISKWRKLHQMLYQMGLVVTDIRRDFSLYEETGESYRTPMARRFGHPSTPWYRSAFVRVVAFTRITPLARGAVRINKRFYLDEESKPIAPPSMM